MTDDKRIRFPKWLDAWLYYRGAPHQQDALAKLYVCIWNDAPHLLSEDSEWFQRYRDRDKLVKSAMYPEGE